MIKSQDIMKAMNVLLVTSETVNDSNLLASYIEGNSAIPRADAVKNLKSLQNDFANDVLFTEKLEYISSALDWKALVPSNTDLFTTALSTIQNMKAGLLSGHHVTENILVVGKASLEANDACAKEVNNETDLRDTYLLIYKEIGLRDILDQAQEMKDKLSLADSIAKAVEYATY